MTKVEVDKVTGLMGNETAEVATDDAVPCSALPLVELWQNGQSGSPRS